MKNIFGSKYYPFSSFASRFLSSFPLSHFHPPLLLRLWPAIRFERVLSVRNQDLHEKGLLHWLRNLIRTGVLLASQRVGIASWVDMDDTSLFGQIHNLHQKKKKKKKKKKKPKHLI
jgi:hypothetical protein